MGLLKNLGERVALRWARRKANGMFGKNWKGKAGGVGMMLMGGAAVLSGLGCVTQAVTGEGSELPSVCWNQVAEGASLFALGLAAFGIRDALGKKE